jgi:hypothetical protein
MFFDFDNSGEITGWHPWHFMFTCLAILGVCWGIAAATWGIGVATAGIVGQGEAHKIKESAPNRIVQQASFEQTWADIRKYDQQVKDAARAVDDWDRANAGWQQRDNGIGTLAQQRAYLVQVLTGVKQQCQTTVENYNADARKYLAADFRADDLPYQVDLADHCKER